MTKPWAFAWTAAKWLVMAVALWYLWSVGAFAADRLRPAPGAAWRVACAIAFLALSVSMLAGRFHFLLRMLGCASLYRRQLEIFFPGILAQQIGSEAAFEAVRILAARQLDGASSSSAIAASIVDRLLGVAALAAIAVASVAFVLDGRAWYWGFAALVAVMAAAPAIPLVCARLLAANPDSALARLPGFRFVASIGDRLSMFRKHVPFIIFLSLPSLAAHFLVLLALYCFASSIGASPVTLGEAVAGGSLALFTTAIPLPMAGLGVGEAAFGEAVARMRGDASPGDFAAIFLVYRFSALALGTASYAWLLLSRRLAGKRGGDARRTEKSGD